MKNRLEELRRERGITQEELAAIYREKYLCPTWTHSKTAGSWMIQRRRFSSLRRLLHFLSGAAILPLTVSDLH